MRAIRLLMICISLMFVRCCISQTCELWDGYPPIFNQFGLSRSDRVYVPAGVDQQYLAKSSADWSGAVAIVVYSIPESLSGPFAKEALDMESRSWFMKCYGNLSLPMLPCRSSCEQYRDNIIPFVLALGVSLDQIGLGIYSKDPNNTLPVNCSSWIYTIPGSDGSVVTVPFFPETGYNYTLGSGSVVEVPCTPSTNISYSDIKLQGCTGQLKQSGLSCYLDCPPLPITDDQYDSITSLQYSMASIGMLCCLFYAFLVLLDVRYLFSFGSSCVTLDSKSNYLVLNNVKHPGVWVNFTVLDMMIFCVSILSTAFLGTQEVWCDGGQTFNIFDPTLVKANTNGQNFYYFVDVDNFVTDGTYCTLQAFGIYYSLVSIQIDIAVMLFSVNIIMWYFPYKRTIKRLGLNSLRKKWYIPYVFILISKPVPIVAAISLSASGNMAFGSGSDYCFIDPTEEDLVISFWIMPTLVGLSISFILILMLIVRTAYIFYQIVINEGLKFKKRIVDQTRFILTVIVSIITQCVAASIYIYYSLGYDKINAEVSDYVNCLLVRAETGCSLSDESYVVSMIKNFFLFLNVIVFVSVTNAGRMYLLIKDIRERITRTMNLTNTLTVTNIVDEINDDEDGDEDDDNVSYNRNYGNDDDNGSRMIAMEKESDSSSSDSRDDDK